METRFLERPQGRLAYSDYGGAGDLRGHGDSSVPWASYDVPSIGGDALALIEHVHAAPAHLMAT